MFALLAAALATSGDLRVDSHMRADTAIKRLAVLPSGAIELPSLQELEADAALPTGETPDEAPTPSPTPHGRAMGKLEDMNASHYAPTPVPNHPWADLSKHPSPGSAVDDKLKSLVETAELPLHNSTPTPQIDSGIADAAAFKAELEYNRTHQADLDAALLKATVTQRLKQIAELEAAQLQNLTVVEAAGAVLGVMTGEPLRVLSDMESFLLELKRAVVGPPAPSAPVVHETAMQIQAAGTHLQMQKLQELQQRPTGETEYVVSVNGIMEYRPPTAHGAVRVVSVLLLLASAIVLGIGWRYGSAPGMYPYVEDCRL